MPSECISPPVSGRRLLTRAANIVFIALHARFRRREQFDWRTNEMRNNCAANESKRIMEIPFIDSRCQSCRGVHFSGRRRKCRAKRIEQIFMDSEMSCQDFRRRLCARPPSVLPLSDEHSPTGISQFWLRASLIINMSKWILSRNCLSADNASLCVTRTQISVKTVTKCRGEQEGSRRRSRRCEEPAPGKGRTDGE